MTKKTVRMPIEELLGAVGTVDAASRTFEVQFLSGERIKRYDYFRDEAYWLEFSKDAAAAKLTRVKAGRAPLLDSHRDYDLRSQLGVVEDGDYKNGIGTARVRLSARDDVKPILQDVQDKIIRNVSAGLRVLKMERRPPDATSEGLSIRHVLEFEVNEISLVPIGADSGAAVLSGQSHRFTDCELLDQLPADPAEKENGMKNQNTPAGDGTANLSTTVAAAAAAAAAPVIPPAAAPATAAAPAVDTAAVQLAERQRIALVHDLVGRHNLGQALAQSLIDSNANADQVRAKVLEQLALRSEQSATRAVGFGQGARAGGEPTLLLRANASEALAHRIGLVAAKDLSQGARDYRGMTLLRLAEEVLTQEGVNVRGRSAFEIVGLSMMSTSDFANILADVANKRLRQAYEEHVPTYARWSRRAANASDFKTINVMALSAAPELQKVDPGGEFKAGSLSDGKESYALVTYGRTLPIARQAIINDDLRAFDRLPEAFSRAARRLENMLVYKQLLDNGNLSDGVALFHATHGNLPTAAAITVASLGLARALMRKQTGLQAEKLNLAPRFLLVGPDKEQEAYQFTSAQFVPATSSAVNEFRSGGRTSLDPVVDAEITGNKWFLAADAAEVDTVEYTFLDGAEGVFLEQQIGFHRDGVELKARLDFAAKAIDFRGLVYNSGA